ncbi:MAG: hypothetical protein EBT03_07285 [Betaproteobacteria bacterium]|nr:hypothetical protein [Betaproteobacteria bacterium]
MRKDTVSVEHARERISAQRTQTSSSFFLPHLLYLLYLLYLFKPPKNQFPEGLAYWKKIELVGHKEACTPG